MVHFTHPASSRSSNEAAGPHTGALSAGRQQRLVRIADNVTD